jgi:hypothetical protein
VTNDAAKAVKRQYKVTFYLSDDATLSPGDTPFSKQTIATALGAGKSAKIKPTYQIPASAPLGAQYLIAVARPIPSKPALRRSEKRAVRSVSGATGRTRAVIPIAVTAPPLSAAIRSHHTHAHVTRVVVRITNTGPALVTSPDAVIRLLRGNNAVLLTARETLDIPAHGHQDLLFVLHRKLPANVRAAVEL